MITDQDQSIINHYKDSLTTNLKNVKIEDLTVWVDPLDGTKEYTEGYLDHVTVLVGIAVGKNIIFRTDLLDLEHYNWIAKKSTTIGNKIHGLSTW